LIFSFVFVRFCIILDSFIFPILKLFQARLALAAHLCYDEGSQPRSFTELPDGRSGKN
jgi:hypothetical protein